MQDPAEKTAEASAHWKSNLELSPLRGFGVELNGLEETEKAGGAKANPSGHSL